MVTMRSQTQRRRGGIVTLAVVGPAMLLVLFLVPHARGFQVPLRMSGQDGRFQRGLERRQSLAQGAWVAGGILGSLSLAPPTAQALVKGNAPPPDLRKAKAGGKPKVGNMEEARELGRQKVRGGVVDWSRCVWAAWSVELVGWVVDGGRSAIVVGNRLPHVTLTTGGGAVQQGRRGRWLPDDAGR